MTAPLLVVNADDYGLTPAVSAGILRGARDGIITSTSVLTLAPAFARTAPWLRDAVGGGGAPMGGGVHLAAVGEDPPLLSAREIPTLVDRRGRLASSWRVLLPRIAARRVDPADLAREFAAQVDAVRRVGLAVDHLDSHQHVHMFPGVSDVVLDLAVSSGVGAVRVTRSASSGPVGRVMRRLAGQFAIASGARGLAFPGDAAGLDEAGALDEAAALAALEHLARSVSAGGWRAVELSAHPGDDVDPDRGRYRWGYRWGDELSALCSPVVRDAVTRHGFVLGRYGDLAPVGAA
jgi:predicted glycoside hydrolase/deacetylase ChbG (UPF0249 family)